MDIGFSGYSIALPVLKCMIHVFKKKQKNLYFSKFATCRTKLEISWICTSQENGLLIYKAQCN